jgi:hypothetical protein
MTDGGHVRAFRLFDCAQAKAIGEEFRFLEWERRHLPDCQECQEILDVFRSQFKDRPPVTPSNGRINVANGYYRSVCCGLEVYVPAGTVFPDCRRHRGLSTIWKAVTGELDNQSTNRGKQDDSAA